MSSKTKTVRNKIVSCAECRRLKLRCDRQFPCHNCIKRGLGAICPEGSLPTRPKVLMEETERLTRQNAELTERIRLLEEGLASIQANISDEVHPLLLRNQNGDDKDPAFSKDSRKNVDEINDSLGTLRIDQDGRAIFLGNTAGVESLFMEKVRQPERPITPTPNILHALGIFSNLHNSKQAVMERLEQFLPDLPLANRLSDFYFDHGAWLYNPIPRSKFFDQVFNRVYTSGEKKGKLSGVTPHNAALLFMIFALGCFLSHSQSEDSCEQYHQLAKTAMSCDAVLVDPTMSAIRTLLLMAFYHLLRDKDGPQHCWALMGLASHMAQNIGLHRDSGRWKLDEDCVQERRMLFWELYWLGITQCLSFGRPPSLMLEFCDCEMPRSDERIESRPGEIKPGFHLRKIQFASECTSQVVKAVLGIKQPQYATILALDRKVRDNQALKIPPNGASGPTELGAATVMLTFQRFMLKALAEMTLLYVLMCAFFYLGLVSYRLHSYLHRRYFVRAVTDYPDNLLHCQFGPSVLATYRSASMYIALMRDLCAIEPELPSRFIVFWNHLLASSIVVGSIVTKCPTCVLAPSSLKELDECYELLNKASSYGGGRAAKALVIVSKIRERAHQITARMQSGMSPVDRSPKEKQSEEEEEELDELAIYSGRARFVSAKTSESTQSSQPSPATKSSTITNLDLHPAFRHFETYHTAHPSLLNNLRHATQQPPVTAQSFRPGINNVSIWQEMSSSGSGSPVQADGTTSGMNIQADCITYNPSFDLNNLGGPNGMPRGLTRDSLSSEPEGMQWTVSKNAFEDGGHGGLGTAMSWESNWQGYLNQLGMNYPDTDIGF